MALDPARRLKTAALGLVRRGRPIAWAPAWMGLGNLLYVALWAYGDPRRRVLEHPNRSGALELFPELRRRIFIPRDEVRMTDQRLMPWREEDELRAAAVYEPPLLEDYIRELLLPGSPIAEPPGDLAAGALVVNVRRGDYFSVPDHERDYGIDSAAYALEAARRSVAAGGSPEEIVVVSDDLDWCRAHLGALGDLAPVRFREGGLAEDLAALVHASRLILPNSTFSYWGGYIGDVLRGPREVHAPWLFNRSINGGRAYQLRPSWRVVESLPGSW